VQREHIAATGTSPVGQLEVALDILLDQVLPSARDRKVLLQMREVIDRLLEQADGKAPPEASTNDTEAITGTTRPAENARRQGTQMKQGTSNRRSRQPLVPMV
jgi:predicted RNA-binding Zn ribbon-like protein